ncbi:MAG: hypothetical protein ETSY1_46400 (plasmid) [Candidatus Entotheonella factor]|uniref:DUF29 domain-containing protein n=1 Tax=Entotheonella factor TaxID=1429438 RepID=W4M226_ENTF1|nr:MAG: hypothetical protein ETSY1_46400 [Candidatus Entotheonella factor]
MTSNYDSDFYEWTQHQAAALAAGHFSELDLANLAEEIESLGKSDRRQLGNRLEVLMLHLLKWRYQPERRQTGHSWEDSILEQRGRIESLLSDSPSLRRQVSDLVSTHYPRARRRANSQTGLPLETFPQTCPWTQDQILDDEFWPGEENEID